MFNLETTKKFIKIFFDLFTFSVSKCENSNETYIDPKKLILDGVHKSLIVFLENLTMDQKIKLSSDLLKKFNENSEIDKIKKLKPLIILKQFKSEFSIKNKYLNIWKNSINNVYKSEVLNSNHNNIKVYETINTNKQKNYIENHEKNIDTSFIEKLEKNGFDYNPLYNIKENQELKDQSKDEKINKEKEIDNNQTIINNSQQMNFSFKKSKRIQLGYKI